MKEPNNFKNFMKIPPNSHKKLQSLLFLNSGIWYDERDLSLISEAPVSRSGKPPEIISVHFAIRVPKAGSFPNRFSENQRNWKRP